MIKAKQTLIGHLTDRGKVQGKLSNAILDHYPELENLEVTPSEKEQKFNHPGSYGYDEITVKAVDGEELKITPSVTEQVQEGLYKKVIVNGDENLVSENIVKDKTIFGVNGSPVVVNTSDADATANDIISPKTAYVNGEKITGNIRTIGNIMGAAFEIEYNPNKTEIRASSPVTKNTVLAKDATYTVAIQNDDLAEFIELTPEKLAEGNTILGIEGTAKTTNAKITNGDYMFYNGIRMDYYNDIMNLIDSVSSAKNMFYSAGITNDDFTKIDFSNCKDMSGFCSRNNNLTEVNIKNMDLSNVETLNGAFSYCSNLIKIDLTGLNAPKVKNLNSFLEASNNIETISFEDANLESVETMTYFVNGYKGKRISFKNSNLKNIKNMFYAFCQTGAIEEIDLTGCDFNNLDSIESLLYGSGVKNLIADFSKTYKLRTVSKMFNSGGSNLTSLSEINAQSVTIVTDMFGTYGTKKLTNWSGLKDLGKAYTIKQANYAAYALKLTFCPNLTHESLVNIINNLYDLNITYNVANSGTLYTQQLVLGSTNLAKLTAEEIAIATNKGWTVS